MAKNEFTVTFRVQEDGSLKQIGQQAEKTGKKIKRGVTDQAHSADRAMKGLSRQSSNATKNFSKMSQGLAGGIVPIYATLAAQVFAISAAFQFLKGAADYRMLLEGQKAFGIATGVMYKGLTKIIMDATDAQITYADAASAVAIGTASGLQPAQLEKLAVAAKRASIALGRDMTDSFNRLIRGATKAEPELLDELGIILRLDPALKKYADKLGKTKDQLTAFQRTQAVTNEILEQAETKYAAIEAIMDPQTNKLNEAAVAFDEMLNAFKLWLAGPVEKLAVFFSKNMTSAIAIVTLFAMSIVRSMLPSLAEWQQTNADNAADHRLKMAGMREDLKAYRAELAATQAQARGGYAAGLGTQQQRAARLDSSTYAAGTGMYMLSRGKTPSKGQLGSLKGQLKKKIGPFSDKALGGNKKQAEAVRKEWDKTFKDMDRNAKGTGRTIKGTMKEISLSGKISAGKLGTQWGAVKTVFMGISKWALRIFGWITKFGLLVLIFQSFAGPLMDWVKGLMGVNESAEMAEEGMQKFIEQQRTLNAEAAEFLQYAKEIETTGYWATIAQKANVVTNLRPLEALDRYGQALTEREAATQTMNISRSRGGGVQSGGPFALGRWLNDLTSRTIGGVLSTELETEVEAKNVVKELREELVKTFDIMAKTAKVPFFEKMREQLARNGDLTKEQRIELERLMKIFNEGKFAISQEQSQRDKLTGARGQWFRPKADNRMKYFDEVVGMQKNLQAQIALAKLIPAKTTEQQEEYMNNVEEEKKLAEDRLFIERVIADLQKSKVDKAKALLEMERVKGSVIGGTQYGKKVQTELKIEAGKADLLAKQAELREKQKQSTYEMSTAEKAKHAEETTNLENSIKLIKQKNLNMELSIDGLHMIETAAVSALETGMSNALMGVLDGTKSLKEGFLDMSKAVLQAIAQIIVKLIAMRAIEAMGFGLAEGGVIPRANGGYMFGGKKPKGYRSGGVVTEPTYLVGEGKYNEAVVPLPDGRSIPVQMSGGASNVSVNVNIASDGQATSNLTQNDGQQAAQLGRAISAAIQEELHKQQRPGGMLSPYGP
tara:strand:+ start:1251 stop:4430 length:3180 start_codon:yes stop_codon:yes gene_type:complete